MEITELMEISLKSKDLNQGILAAGPGLMLPASTSSSIQWV